jgi:hypothetical protein
VAHRVTRVDLDDETVAVRAPDIPRQIGGLMSTPEPTPTPEPDDSYPEQWKPAYIKERERQAAGQAPVTDAPRTIRDHN